MPLRDWSQTASGNASVANINFAEGQAPGTVNNSARELMAQIRQQYQPAQWNWIEISATASVNTQTIVKVPGNLTGDFWAGRRVRFSGGSTKPTRYVLSASFTSETTVTLRAGASLSASHTIVAFPGIDGAGNIFVASSVAELQALTVDRFSGNKIYLTGYYPTASYSSSVVLGGGWLSLREGDFTTTADGALYFADASSRRWMRDHQGQITLGQCGAKADGTDDLTAVNRAIALLNNGQSNIEVLISDPGNIGLSGKPDPLTRADRSIVAPGFCASAWRMRAGTAAGTFIEIGAPGGDNVCQRTFVSGLSFLNDNETSLTGSFAAIHLRNSTQTIIENCHFSGCATVLRFGDSATLSGTQTLTCIATRAVISNIHAQPTLINGSPVVDIQGATGSVMSNCRFFGGGTGKDNCNLVKIAPVATSEGCDNFLFTNCTWNFNGSDLDYGFVFDASEKGMANIRFSNCVMDGGAEYSILFKIGSAAASVNNRIYNVGISNCRITASTSQDSPSTDEGGGGIHILHEADNYINGIEIVGNVFTIGPKRGVYHERSGGVDVNATGFVISNNTFANAYTNADGNSTHRPVMEINGNGFVITGNSVNVINETTDDTSGANFFSYFAVIGTGAACNNVIAGNEVSRIDEAIPVDTSILSASDFMLGPKIANNAGKGDGPVRTALSTSATPVNLATQAMATATEYVFKGTVIGRAGNVSRAWYEFEALARSSATGSATLVASTVTTKHETEGAWATTLDTSGSNFRIRVQSSATASWGLFDPICLLRRNP